MVLPIPNVIINTSRVHRTLDADVWGLPWAVGTHSAVPDTANQHLGGYWTGRHSGIIALTPASSPASPGIINHLQQVLGSPLQWCCCCMDLGIKIDNMWLYLLEWYDVGWVGWKTRLLATGAVSDSDKVGRSVGQAVEVQSKRGGKMENNGYNLLFHRKESKVTKVLCMLHPLDLFHPSIWLFARRYCNYSVLRLNWSTPGQVQ